MMVESFDLRAILIISWTMVIAFLLKFYFTCLLYFLKMFVIRFGRLFQLKLNWVYSIIFLPRFTPRFLGTVLVLLFRFVIILCILLAHFKVILFILFLFHRIFGLFSSIFLMKLFFWLVHIYFLYNFFIIFFAHFRSCVIDCETVPI